MLSTALTATLFLLALAVITATQPTSARSVHQSQSPAATAAAPSPSTTGANTTDDLIATACQHAQYPDVCNSTLRSQPGSHTNDLRGLAYLSIDLAIAHARETLAMAKRLSHAGGSYSNDSYASQCLRDCQDQYDDAIADLGASKDALRQGIYDDVNAQLSGAMSDAESCEDGFTDKPGSYGSPLGERNGYFHKLCSNSLAITSLLAV